ncbi:MAG: hypothetical protein AB1690_07340 [Candidatus Zixiibacteriota bacterium]
MKTASEYIFHGCLLVALLMPLSGHGSNGQPADNADKIDSVIIETRNVFNTDSAQFNNWLFKMANKLHIKTRKFVVERELLLNKGDLYSAELAAETERNLRSLPFIWDATVVMDKVGDANILKITTSDRWTLVGGPSISRSAGQTIYEVGIEELNLFGYGQFLAFHHYLRSIDKDYSEFSFVERRLFSSRYYFSLYYNDAPEIGRKSLTFRLPLFSQSSRLSYGATVTEIDRTDDYYRHGVIVARNRTEGKYLESFILTQSGTYESKIQFGINHLYADLKTSDKRGLGVRFPSDSLYHLIMPQFGLLRTEFYRTSRINGFRRVEDINLTNGAYIKYGWAISPARGDRLYDLLSFSYQYSSRQKYGFLFLGFERNHWFKGNIDYRTQLILSMKYYNNTVPWMTSVFAGSFLVDERRDRNHAYYLGENYGLRGYPRNFESGEKAVIMNFENRLFTGLNLMSVDIGAVQFVDLGQICLQDQGIQIGNWFWSAGIGLRLGMEKISNAELMRIDFAYAPEIRNWQVSLGFGQFVK